MLFGRFKPVDVIDTAGKRLQPVRKGLVMLQCQDGCGNQHGNLLAFSHHLECRTDGDLCFSKSDISANQSVHRVGLFKILFYIDRGLDLIRRVFVNKRSLQFSLQIGIRGAGKSGSSPPFSIQFDQLLCNILDPALRFVLQLIPYIRSQPVHGRCSTILADVLGDPVQRMNAYIQQILILVNQPDSLLFLAVVDDLFQSVKPSDAMINMGHIIPRA